MSGTETSRGDGQQQGRVEDPRLLAGKGKFVDDLKMENQAYMGLVRSPHAHARIKGIDFSRARSSPSFIASLTGEDLLKEGVQQISQNPWPPQKRARRYHLAVGRARFVGEPVAAVLSRDKNSLEDLIEAVEVEYEVLPAVTTIEESKKGKARLYDDWEDNVSLRSEVKRGDAEKAIALAAYVIEAREGIARQVSMPIEPHSTLVTFDSDDGVYDVYATVQSVHGLQNQLASELSIPKEKFHVRVMDVGGGFGSKGAQSYPGPLLACLFARRTGLPVKWTATRREEFLEAAAGRDEYCDVTLACDKDGRVVALKARVEGDAGVAGTQNHMSSLTLWTMGGPYSIPNQDLEVVVYVTNKMPLGPLRGAGAPEGCYFIERAMDIMARKIGLDPAEFRRRNLARPGSPTAGAGCLPLLDALVKSPQYAQLLRWRDETNSRFRQQGASGSPVVAGLGISVRGSGESGMGGGFSGAAGGSGSWQGTAAGASAREYWTRQRGGQPGASSQWRQTQESGSWRGAEQPASARGDSDEGALEFTSETARVTLDKAGNVRVYTGSSPHGQGEETTFAQLASEELGFPLAQVNVVWGDTVLIPRGIGTFGSRSAATGGSAVVEASRKLKSQILAIASEAVGVDVESLEIRNGILVNRSKPGAWLPPLTELLAKRHVDEISGNSVFTLGAIDYSSGVHLCALTLDLELAKARVVRYVVAEDCGRMINKTIVEGQLHGGVVHGIGGALIERLAYDEDGNLLSTTLTDYNILTASDTPNVEVLHRETPSKSTLNGAKGVGESGTIGAYAAVMNALNDALSQAGVMVEMNVAPATGDSIFAVLHSVA